jgi:hypothetical protein
MAVFLAGYDLVAEVLQEVEWQERVIDSDTKIVYECPVCFVRKEYWDQKVEHKPDCKFKDALAIAIHARVCLNSPTDARQVENQNAKRPCEESHQGCEVPGQEAQGKAPESP